MALNRFCFALAVASLLAFLEPTHASGQGSPATLTPEQEKSLADVRQMVKDTARVYTQYTPFEVKVAPWLGKSDLTDVAGLGAMYTGTTLFLAPAVLGSPYRDALIARILAQDILRAPSRATSTADYERELVQRSLDANAKAVEILVRVKGLAERDALKAIYDRLLALHRLASAGGKLAAGRKIQPCDEIRELLSRFPQHRDWTAGLECAP